MAIDSAPRFVHLHLHSHYSLLDGGNRIDKLIDRIAELGMDAVALTDHGNLHGAIEFYRTARARNIKPILGIEAYVAPGDRRRREVTGIADGGFHLVLLAENLTGWRNLLKLSSDAYLNGFYYRPRMDRGTLEQWSDGLIAINGHLGSSLAYYLLNHHRTGKQADWDKAVEEATWHARTFGTNDRGERRFFIELQRIGENEQEQINPLLVRLAKELKLPLVCDNDAHFLMREDHDAHDSLICISTGKIKEEPNRLRYPPDLYVKSPQEMASLFGDYLEGAGREALENTARIADRCNVELDFDANHAPIVKIEKASIDLDGLEAPAGSTEWYTAFCSQYSLHPFDAQHDHDSPEALRRQCDRALRELAEVGAIWRYGEDGVTDEIRQRIEWELKVLSDKLISAYFLIVWDFVNEGRRRNIPVNARGSACGTIVGYCLGISNACPVRYGLLFERFTDPDRSEYPDIDIDICQDGRQEIIEYVRQKYGHVAQIITFGTLKARAAIRDVGRVHNIPLPEVDRIAKLVPEQLGITLDEALKVEPDLKKLYDDNPVTRQLLDTAIRLEGLARHSGIHAAGVVVATEPLENIVPLHKAGHGDDLPVCTQWDGPTCEKMGLLKVDFLGLRTLSVIERCRQLVRATLDEEIQFKTITGQLGAGPVPGTPREFGLKPGQASDSALGRGVDPLDLERLTYVDQNVLDLFRRGDTAGVFQFESGGMRNVLMGMKPDRFEDLIAANALYRPGPMALIPDYNDRKLGRVAVPPLHETVEKHTGATFGVITYQEQVMQLLHELGGVPLREAYAIIKAISKKKREVIDAAGPLFIEGAVKRGLSNAEAEELFRRILEFSGYGFNKSHSTGYTLVAYQTAYLKTYFPVQYMAALLTYESISTDKVVEYIDECRRVRFPDGQVGIDVRPPDVNKSFLDFSVVYDDDEPHDANHGHIRFGLGAVKGVGGRAVEQIIEVRTKDGPFKSLFDFCERVPQGLVNKSVIEALIKCGAFDSLHGASRRSALLAAVESAISRGQQEASLRNADDFLFGTVAKPSAPRSQDESEASDAAADQPALANVPPWDSRTTLAEEKSVLGFYVSAHPLDEHRDTLARFASVEVRSVRRLRADAEVIVGGMLTRVRPTFVKNGRSAGQRMAMITIEDHTGPIDGVVFSDTYARHAHLLENDRIVFMHGRVDRRREEPSIVVDEVIPVEEAAAKLTGVVKIRISATDREGRPRKINGELSQLRNILSQMPGQAKVYLEVFCEDRIVMMSTSYRVRPTANLPAQIDGLLRDDHCCTLIGPDKIVEADPAALLAEGEDTITDRLRVDPSDTHCESIDRY